MSHSLLGAVRCGSRCFDPLNSLAHLPDALPLLALLDVDSFSVLLALAPLADVLAAVGPLESAVSVLLIILVAAHVPTPVTPREGALAFHFVVDPLSAVYSPVGPSVLTLAMNIILEEVAFVCALVRPNEFSSAVLHSLLILAIVLGSIRPLLDSEAMLFVCKPLALVTTTVEVSIHSVAIGLVFCPLAFVYIAFSVDESTIAIGHAIAPKSIVPGSIWPNLDSTTVLLTLSVGLGKPLTLINSSVFEDTDWFDVPVPLVDFLDGPVEGLQLIDDIHDDLVVVRWLEYVQLLELELLNNTLSFDLLLVLVSGAYLTTWYFAFRACVLVGRVAANSHFIVLIIILVSMIQI